MIIFDHFEEEKPADDKESLDSKEIEFFKPSEAPKKEEKKKEVKKPAGFDPFFDMMGGDSDDDEMDLMDFDNFKAPPKKKDEPKKEEANKEDEAKEVKKESEKLLKIKMLHSKLC